MNQWRMRIIQENKKRMRTQIRQILDSKLFQRRNQIFIFTQSADCKMIRLQLVSARKHIQPDGQQEGDRLVQHSEEYKPRVSGRLFQIKGLVQTVAVQENR